MFHMPMSSPMMKRMLGFLSCAWLGTTAHIRAVATISTVKTELGSLLSLIVSLFLSTFLFSFLEIYLPGERPPVSRCADSILFAGTRRRFRTSLSFDSVQMSHLVGSNCHGFTPLR